MGLGALASNRSRRRRRRSSPAARGPASSDVAAVVPVEDFASVAALACGCGCSDLPASCTATYDDDNGSKTVYISVAVNGGGVAVAIVVFSRCSYMILRFNVYMLSCQMCPCTCAVQPMDIPASPWRRPRHWRLGWAPALRKYHTEKQQKLRSQKQLRGVVPMGPHLGRARRCKLPSGLSDLSSDSRYLLSTVGTTHASKVGVSCTTNRTHWTTLISMLELYHCPPAITMRLHTAEFVQWFGRHPSCMPQRSSQNTGCLVD